MDDVGKSLFGDIPCFGLSLNLGLKAECAGIIYFTRRNSRQPKKNGISKLPGGVCTLFSLVLPI